MVATVSRGGSLYAGLRGFLFSCFAGGTSAGFAREGGGLGFSGAFQHSGRGVGITDGIGNRRIVLRVPSQPRFLRRDLPRGFSAGRRGDKGTDQQSGS